MSEMITPLKNEHPKRILWETIIVLLISTVPFIFFPSVKAIGVFIPVLYVLVEHRVRKRSWSDFGIRPKRFFQDLRSQFFWVILVAVVIQVGVVFAANWFFPEFLAHITARLPFVIGGSWIPIVVSLFFATFVEEFVYRGLFQQRFGWFMPTSLAILLVSLIFSLLHIASGIWFVILIDVLLIFVDSIIYGLIFARSKNLLVAWVAHFLADVVALVLMVGVARGL
jgi:membrane protease YdiL (CAAX protease family)